MRYEVSCLSGVAASGPYEVIVLKPRGRMTSLEAVYFGQELQEVCGGRYPNVLVDMADVIFLDSCGIGSLVGGLKVAKQQGVRLALASLHGPVRLAAELICIDQLFEIYENAQQFLDALATGLSTSLDS
ncbi:STAS domain-containing protein [Leptolyngbya sp. FACHB-261]|uniref:STAS domain-containing protein n=1 Tax=Leptolyngbya sp. FACHB-261 TaxID=2692806 RepID=UPI001688A608|nr:STAS domain-containing protein [Leptolyngbya sp. FACHB-261]MBD2103288.1 STAS domain-containing protein [Leptolyngbya sp. FACHB-261]